MSSLDQAVPTTLSKDVGGVAPLALSVAYWCAQTWPVSGARPVGHPSPGNDSGTLDTPRLVRFADRP